MSQPVANRVYIDSSVLINWYSGDSSSRKFVKAYSFLKDVRDGKYEGIVSLLAMKEVIKFIRNIFVKKGEANPDKWMTEEKNVIERIARLQGIRIVEGRPEERSGLLTNDMIFGSVSRDALETMLRYGEVVF